MVRVRKTMKRTGSKIDRLLRAAAATPNEKAGEMPFGFDTRVVAQWRADAESDSIKITRLLRRVVWLSLAVIALATAGAYQELRSSDNLAESVSDEYAIADSAIGMAFEQ